MKIDKLRHIADQFWKFSLIGGICFIIDAGTLSLLTNQLGVYYLISNTISFTIAVIVNYFLNMQFVFKDRKNKNRKFEFVLYVILNTIGWGLNQLLLWIFVGSIGLSLLLAKIIATGIVTIYNFISRKIFIEGTNIPNDAEIEEKH